VVERKGWEGWRRSERHTSAQHPEPERIDHEDPPFNVMPSTISIDDLIYVSYGCVNTVIEELI